MLPNLQKILGLRPIECIILELVCQSSLNGQLDVESLAKQSHFLVDNYWFDACKGPELNNWQASSRTSECDLSRVTNFFQAIPFSE